MLEHAPVRFEECPRAPGVTEPGRRRHGCGRKPSRDEGKFNISNQRASGIQESGFSWCDFNSTLRLNRNRLRDPANSRAEIPKVATRTLLLQLAKFNESLGFEGEPAGQETC